MNSYPISVRASEKLLFSQILKTGIFSPFFYFRLFLMVLYDTVLFVKNYEVISEGCFSVFHAEHF